MNHQSLSYLAVVGLGASVGTAATLQQLSSLLYDGAQILERPTGTPVELVQQVIAAALADAAVEPEQAVSLLIQPDGQLPTNLTFAHVDQCESQAAALTRAHALLTEGVTQAVVLAAVSLPDAEPATATEPFSLSYNRETQQIPTSGGGAAAIVLQTAPHRRAIRGRIYALLAAQSSATVAEPTAAVVAHCGQAALRAADTTPASIEYLELHASGIAAEDNAELSGLCEVYRKAAPESYLSCAVGSIRANVGHAQQLGALLGLLRAALCLYQRYIPAVPNWSRPHRPDAWQQSLFAVDAESRPWSLSPNATQRVAALSSLERVGTLTTISHLVLCEEPVVAERRTGYLQQRPLQLFPLAGAGEEALQTALTDLSQQLDTDSDLRALAQRCFKSWQQHPDAPYTLSLVAADPANLQREIERAITGMPAAFANGSEWKTPAGSLFTPHPLGTTGKVAFVYPGAFNSYVGLGRHLMQLFPTLHEWLVLYTDSSKELLGDEVLYPRSQEQFTTRQLKQHEQEMLAQAIQMLEIGPTFSVLYTTIIRHFFDIQPDIVFGYSQGEASMMHALGVWRNSGVVRERLHASDLYKTELAGQQQAVRRFWGLPLAPANAPSVWANYILMTSAEQVQPHLETEPHVYLAIINSPREVMISGDPAGCQRIIKQIGCRSLQAPFNQVIHSPPVQLVYDEFVALNIGEVHPVPGVQFYSAADYAPIHLSNETVAHSLAQVYCKLLDFPRLVEQIYSDGGRIFIELGSARNCTHWIGSILGERPHTAVAINKKGTPDHVSLVRLLAQLVSHRVPLDLTPLYEDTKRLCPPTQTGTTTNTTAPLLNSHHLAYLQKRREELQQLQQEMTARLGNIQSALAKGGTISVDIDTLATPEPTLSAPTLVNQFTPTTDVLIDEQKVYEFTLGSVVACFGPEYIPFEVARRRTPRIPNSDLQMVSRVVRIDGKPHAFEPGTLLVSELDVPVDAWFFTDNAYPTPPYSILMEIAMQPCGFLSAYLGSVLLFPEVDFYFRNLDGRSHLHKLVELRGRTLTQEARLISSTSIEGTIIQKYTFRLLLDSACFFEGEAIFGYFTAKAMDNQVGLDSGRPTLPWYQQQPQPPTLVNLDLHDDQTRQRLYRAPAERPFYRLSEQHLDLLDQVIIIPEGGEQGQGYVYAQRRVDPDDWFFACHFYQDPVMPGSLGVEAVYQALQAYALHMRLGANLLQPHFEALAEQTTTWKYRGQIIREVEAWSLEVHITQIDIQPQQIIIRSNANLWRGQLRIYEFRGIGLRIAATTAT